MGNMDSAIEQLIKAVRDSEVYCEYDRQRNRVKEHPDLKVKIDEFRSRNYQLQNESDYSFAKIDEFEQEYADFRENPMVSDFLAAELAFCRMMQDISIRITEAIDFE